MTEHNILPFPKPPIPPDPHLIEAEDPRVPGILYRGGVISIWNYVREMERIAYWKGAAFWSFIYLWVGVAIGVAIQGHILTWWAL